MTKTTVMPESIVAVTLSTRNIEGQRRFYEAWGWTAVPYSNDEYVAFSLGATTLAFYLANKLAEEAEAPPLPDGAWNGVTLALAVPEKEGVNPTWQAAVAAGATAISQPTDRPWGGRSGYVADPEGNRWEIVWIPAMGG